MRFGTVRGILTLEDVATLGKDGQMTKIEKEICKVHSYSIYPEGDRWRTYIEDLTKKSGRRAVVRTRKEDLLLFLIEHYKLAPELMKEDCKTFAEVFDLVWEYKARYVETEKDKISFKNTKQRCNSSYRKYIEGTFIENMPVNKIKKDDLDELFVLNLKRYKMKNKAFLNLRGIVKSVLKFALSKYWIDDNPYDRILFQEYKRLLHKDNKTNADRVHSDEEIKMMLEELHTKQKKDPTKSSFWAMEAQIIAGFRRGEMPPLTWNDVKDTHIVIHQQQLTDGNDFTIVDETKTGIDRNYPIGRNLREFLQRLRERNEQYYSDSIYLFPSNDTKNGVITNRAVYEVYDHLCEKLGIEKQKDVVRGPHSFRRNAITSFVNESNGNFEMASAIFGNSPEIAKKNYYTGIDLEKASEILDKRQLV